MLRPRRVVILGAGFAGLACARALRSFPGQVIVVDRTNHHLFQPLLYQVATAGLSGSDIAQPIRALLRHQPNLSVHMAGVEAIDPLRRVVRLDFGGYELDYDYLVIALGVTNNWFGHEEWAEHAMGLKTLRDAEIIRDRLLSAYERAENLPHDPRERAKQLTTVVIGAGPTGVEMAGACAELARRVLKPEFRLVNMSDARIVLMDAGPRVLATFDPLLSDRAARDLSQMGVDVRLNTRVERIERGAVIAGAERIEAQTIIWAAGVQAPALTKGLLPFASLDRSGRIQVDSLCRLKPAETPPPNFDEVLRGVYAVGDIAAMTDGAGVRVPAVAQGAMQSGRFVGRSILADIGERATPPPFVYSDKGSMATIGRRRAIAHLGPIKAGGVVAWLLWLVVHLLFLVDLRSKVSVLLKWGSAYLFYRPTNRLIEEVETPAPRNESAKI